VAPSVSVKFLDRLPHTMLHVGWIFRAKLAREPLLFAPRALAFNP
jgi:hypothetical protein